MVELKSQQTTYVFRFCECTREISQLVGGKNANLGELINQGFLIPDGFAISVISYKKAIKNVQDKIYDTLEGLHSEDMVAVNEVGNKVRELIRSVGIPPDVKEEIKQYYQELSDKYSTDNIPVAVRSSATAEDLPGASFAGQQDTYLWISGVDNLIDAVSKCWASLYSSRAICYRIKNCFQHENTLISVGVQRMINPRSAGVMFTINPTNGDRSKITIGANWGLGESVVGGDVNPDEWMIDKVMLEIIKRDIGNKKMMHEIDLYRKEVVIRDIPMEKQDIPCMSDQEVIELAKIGKAIEQHYREPQDIEWAIEKNLPFPKNIFILQSRPETVWFRREKKAVLGKHDSLAGHVSNYLIGLKA